MERHTTQQSMGWVWNERTATEEQREHIIGETSLDVTFSYRRPMGYEWGKSKVRLRPVVEDESYPLLVEEEMTQRIKRERKVRSDKGKPRKPRTRLERAQRAEARHVYPTHPTQQRRQYPVAQPVIEPAIKPAPRYLVTQPVLLMPTPPWWRDVSRNAEVIRDLESLLDDMM